MAANSAPVISTTSYTTTEDTLFSGNIGATDANGDAITYKVGTTTANGTLTLNTSTGAFTYQGKSNWAGADTFSVTATDSKGAATTKTITLNVGAVADVPSLTVANATASVTALTLTGTAGNDVLTGGWGKDTITGGAGDDVITGDGAAKFTVALSITGSLVDADGSETLAFKLSNVPSDGVLSAGTKNADGTWSLTTAQLTGLTLTTAAASNFALTVAATATEASNGNSAIKTGTINVTVPAGTGDADTIDGGIGNDTITGGKGNDTITGGAGDDTFIFAKGDGLDTLTDTSGADTIKLGTGIISSNLSYTRSGTDLVIAITGGDQITVKDHFGASPVESLILSDGSKINLMKVINLAPTLTAATFSGTEDNALVGQLAASDWNGDALTYSITTAAAKGTVSLNASTGAFTYTGNKDWSGTDTFTVKVSDGAGGSSIQTMTVSYAAVADTPTVSAASVSLPPTAGARTVALDIKGALIDTDGSEALTFKLDSLPGDAVLSAGTKNADGSWTLTPAQLSGLTLNTATTTDFTVQVTATATESSNGATALASANFNVYAPQPGQVLPNLFMGFEDQSIAGTVSTTGIAGSGFTFTLANGQAAAQHGTVAINSTTGAFTYLGASNYSGTDSFDVQIKDSGGTTTTKTVNIDLEAVADAPTITANNLTVPLTTFSLTGTTGADTLKGGVGNDTLKGGDGNDTLWGDTVVPFTIPLDVTAALKDLDGSETLRVKFSSLPPGSYLSAGHYAYEKGSWWVDVDSADLAGLKLTAASASDFTAVVTAYATEGSNSAFATKSASFTVHVPTGAGDDTLDGGAGNDTIHGGVGNDTIAGGLGDDMLFGDAGNDTIAAGEGKDSINGGDGDDTLDAGAGDDSVFGGDGNDTIHGGDGKDSINAGDGNDTAYGDAGDDKIDGGTGDDTLYGGLGNDIVVGAAGNDTLYGEDGNDLVYGGAGDDKLYGGAGNDMLYGEAGDDVMDGGDGNDLLNGGPGNDTLWGGAGNDRLWGGEGNDVLHGGADGDTLLGGGGNDVIYGDGGNDIIDGGDGADTIYGGDDADTIKGGAGDDVIDAGAGNDKVDGGEGNDRFIGGDGNDKYAGGGGFDTLDYSAMSAAINANLALNKVVHGLFIDSTGTIEKVIGTAFDDTLIGSTLDDTLVGGNGADIIHGGNGNDTLWGGAGNDKFVWALADLGTTRARPVDTIKDFGNGTDVLDVRALAAGQTFANRWDAVQVRDTTDGSVVAVNVKGAGFIDVVMLEGVHNVTAQGLYQANELLV